MKYKEKPPIDNFIPAEEAYDLYAGFYDAMTTRHVDDLPIYQQIAAANPPPYLEVGCGTGRVLSHLLSQKPDNIRGHYLSGVDVSDAMLSICIKKTSASINDGLLQVMKHDFSFGTLKNQKFNAAFVTFFTFNYIPESLQQDFLANINASLNPGGVIAIDCFYPYIKWHPEADNKLVDKEPVVMDGKPTRFQEKPQMITPTIEQREWIFTNPDGASNAITTTRTYLSPEKGKSLLEDAGFTDVGRIFDYRLPITNDFAEGSHGYNFMLMARKP